MIETNLINTLLLYVQYISLVYLEIPTRGWIAVELEI